MQFRVLGNLEVRVNGQPVRFDIPKRRTLLLALLSQANTVVSIERLLEWLWPEGPPRSAVAIVQVHVSHLRRVLEPDRPRRAPPRVLLTRTPGYMLRVSVDQVDALRFEHLVRLGQAQLAARQFQAATTTLSEALRLWRGPALADADGVPAVRAVAVRWEELRQFASVMRIEAELELGRHLSVIPELEYLVAAHPYDERVHGLLMLALYRSRRRADALATYRRLSESLRGELRTEPTAALRRLSESIRTQAPELDTQPPHTLV